MSFMELFAAPGGDEPEGRSWVSPPWFGPPQHELPAAVPLSRVVGRSEHGAVAVSHALVHSTGVVLDVVAVARGLRERDAQRVFHEQHLPPDDDELSPGFLRFGIELPDGARASNLVGRRSLHDPERPPTAPVLVQHGGGGGSAGQGEVVMRPGYWLWPLPAPGPVRLSCEWPLAGIPLSTVELDGAALRDAAARAVPLFD